MKDYTESHLRSISERVKEEARLEVLSRVETITAIIAVMVILLSIAGLM
jgi:hypothetical protein